MPSGPRIRTDNVFGTVTDNPLTNSATTLNSAGLANLAAVSSAHAIIVLDPLRAAGAPEAVIVTAHTGSATSATITRGAYGTSARQHAQGTLWVHASTIEDFIRIVTSSTRPSDPYEGQLAYETDTNRWIGYDGSLWRPTPHNPPACRITHSTTQSITNNTTTALLADSETYDTDSMHSTSSNTSRITMNKAGIYVVTSFFLLAGDSDYTFLEWAIRQNGSTDLVVDRNLNPGTSSTARRFQATTQMKFAANDYVETTFSHVNTNAGANNVSGFVMAATMIGIG